MSAYRTQASGESVVLDIVEAGFWRRFLANLGVARWRIAITFALAMLPGLIIAAMVLTVAGETGLSVAKYWFFGLWAALALPVFSMFLYTALVGALESTIELLPRRIVMRADRLTIHPRGGDAEEVAWSWIVGARELGGGIELSLARDRALTIFVRTTAETPRVRAWLTSHGLLATGP